MSEDGLSLYDLSRVYPAYLQSLLFMRKLKDLQIIYVFQIQAMLRLFQFTYSYYTTNSDVQISDD